MIDVNKSKMRGEKMSREKFMIYKIKIAYGDGTVEYRQDEGYSAGNYEDMKVLYRKVQEEVCHKDCKVILLGVNYRGGNSMIKERDFSKSSTEEQQIYDTSFVEYARQIKDILVKMKKKRDYHVQVLDAVEKKDSIIDHRIETFKRKAWDNEDEMIQEKIKIFDESEAIKKERRHHKDELEIILSIRDEIDLDDVYDAFDVDVKDDSKFQYLDESMVRHLGLMKEVYYSSEKDRVCKIKSLKKQYDKVKIDVKNRKIICYNKAATRI